MPDVPHKSAGFRGVQVTLRLMPDDHYFGVLADPGQSLLELRNREVLCLVQDDYGIVQIGSPQKRVGDARDVPRSVFLVDDGLVTDS